jgi:hypothetical protein
MMALRDLIATPGEIVAAAITKEFRFDGNALADLTALITERVNEEVKLARYAARFGARSQAIDDCTALVSRWAEDEEVLALEATNDEDTMFYKRCASRHRELAKFVEALKNPSPPSSDGGK